MKQLTLLVLGMSVLSLFGGCASHRYTVMEPAESSLGDYNVLEISDFKSNLNDEDSVRLADSFADKLFKEVMKDRARHPDESIFETVTRSPDSTGKVLVLEGTVGL